MGVDYRLMRAGEERETLLLWCRSPDDLDYQLARLVTDLDPYAHTFVAVTSDGTILSTLHYRMSVRYDAAGIPRRVGEIDSVVTRAEARRQGHASRLLLLALEALRSAGCAWSLLVATDEGRPLYERYGWKCVPERWRRGTVTSVLAPAHKHYTIRPYDPCHESAGWEALARVDIAFNERRPLTVVRDLAFWHDYAAMRVGTWMRDEGLVIFAAFRKEGEPDMCGYAMAEFYPPCFQVRDLGVLPSESGAALALLTAVAAEAQRRGIPLAARLYLPEEPAIDQALDHLLGTTLHNGADQGHLMACPLADDFTERQLEELFAAPNAHLSAIDLF